MTIPFNDLLAMVPVQERKSAETLFAAILGPQPDAEADIPEGPGYEDGPWAEGWDERSRSVPDPFAKVEAVEGMFAGIDRPVGPGVES